MEKKIYKLHFRERTPHPLYSNGELNDIVRVVEATSKKAAKEYGKSLARQRDNFWFMGIV